VSVCPPPDPPRLLYVGDVPVEETVAGASLLFRLFDGYPADRLTIFHSNLPNVRASDRRLPGLRYEEFEIGSRRLLHSRGAGWYSAHILARSARTAAAIAAREPAVYDGVITVAHAYSWLTAARLAERWGVPLHLVLHDDCIETTGITPFLRRYADRAFSRTLAEATSRFSISPGMQQHLLARYRASSLVILPTRGRNAVAYLDPPERPARLSRPFTIAFAGSISPGYATTLERLMIALGAIGGRLEIFGPDSPPALRERLRGAVFHPFVPPQQLQVLLRDRADALFVPMSFDAADTGNMSRSFPSKLADFTAVGLPILIAGPPYCSAVGWANANPGVALVVTRADGDDLAEAVTRLASDALLREDLARAALRVGGESFSHERGQQKFFAALAGQRA
jgi:glycosyltransferase involved in cell wall biosynthesis